MRVTNEPGQNWVWMSWFCPQLDDFWSNPASPHPSPVRSQPSAFVQPGPCFYNFLRHTTIPACLISTIFRALVYIALPPKHLLFGYPRCLTMVFCLSLIRIARIHHHWVLTKCQCLSACSSPSPLDTGLATNHCFTCRTKAQRPANSGRALAGPWSVRDQAVTVPPLHHLVQCPSCGLRYPLPSLGSPWGLDPGTIHLCVPCSAYPCRHGGIKGTKRDRKGQHSHHTQNYNPSFHVKHLV